MALIAGPRLHTLAQRRYCRPDVGPTLAQPSLLSGYVSQNRTAGKWSWADYRWFSKGCREAGHYLNACSFIVNNWTFTDKLQRNLNENNMRKMHLKMTLQTCIVSTWCVVTDLSVSNFLCVNALKFLVPKKQLTVTQWHFGVSRVKVERILGANGWVKTGEHVNANNSHDAADNVKAFICMSYPFPVVLLIFSTREPCFWPYLTVGINCLKFLIGQL